MVAVPTPHRFTREEYYRMGEAGLFAEERVELLGGRDHHHATTESLTRRNNKWPWYRGYSFTWGKFYGSHTSANRSK